MNGLYTNSNARQDFVRTALGEHSNPPCNVNIAVAFFTERDDLLHLINAGCQVRLIVRLGFPTAPYALQKLMQEDAMSIRYFTGSSFHPKLFIFGTKVALVGSANLTQSA